MAQVQRPAIAPGPTAPGPTAPGPTAPGPAVSPAPRPTGQRSRPLPSLISELWDLIVAYAKQETIDPLKALGRFIGFGIPGALFIVIGLVSLSIGGLRALQVETGGHLTGNWSWAPYGIITVFCLAVAGLAVWAIFRHPKEHS